jgi:hypothetical protein
MESFTDELIIERIENNGKLLYKFRNNNGHIFTSRLSSLDKRYLKLVEKWECHQLRAVSETNFQMIIDGQELINFGKH